MMFKSSWLSVPSRRCLPYRLPGGFYSTPWHLQEFQNKRQVKSAPECSSTQRRLLWGRSEPPQHFGPKSRIPDLFERKDEMHLKLATQQLEWHGLPPPHHHDMLEAVARVGRIEERIQYTFRNKMLCVEALKVTTSNSPLFFKGMIHQVKQNNRLALLGDRALSMVLCDIWYDTGYSPDMKIGNTIATTIQLYSKARKLGIDKDVLIGEGMDIPSVSQVAESFEAIFGAVYVDSDRSLETVKKVIESIDLGKQKFLEAASEAHNDLQFSGKKSIVYQKEELLFMERIRSLEHDAEKIQEHLRDAGPSITGVSGVKPNINPEARSAIRKEATKLERNARRLLKEVIQIDASAVCYEVKVNVRRRTRVMIHTALALKSEVTYSDGIAEEQSNEEPAIDLETTNDLDPIVLLKDESLPPDESAQDGTHETTKKQPDSLNCLFLSENSTDDTPKLIISASPKSTAIPADSVLPKDSNATIIDLIAEFNEVITECGGPKKRGIGRPSRAELGFKYTAWKNALSMTNKLERRGKSADTLAIYEDMLQKCLEKRLIIERKRLAARKEKALSKNLSQVLSLKVEKPETSTPTKEEINLTKEQDQNQEQEQEREKEQKKKRLAPAHDGHEKASRESVESVEDLEQTISELHTATWESTNKTAERAPQHVLWRPFHSPQTGVKVRGRVGKTTSPFQGKTTSEAPPRTWSMRKPLKPLVWKPAKSMIRYRTSTSPRYPTSRNRAAP
ncbi:hypothetical protein COCHEDRAFT_1194455 [Bipolaris maydis C5]|uniref:RNase III domain-containing protein n=1 Tax=Cochliobolus heterostrophus (strain C5 / ATCC 48332 / race O) TaxID=701091 RepID=M2UV38_COCH5|nr:hypothetical protein COCHEDRAFT_1194455 [Bipolaris maydis C5]KAJ6209068.1 hypothetical protein PSV09DRAFT_1194455 [Bipolaris maydis]